MKTLKLKMALKVKIPPVIQQVPLKAPSINDDCTQIIDNIYISSFRTSLDFNYLNRNNFSHIINCAGESSSFVPTFFNRFTYFNIPLRDTCTSDILKAILKFLTFIKEIQSKEVQSKILLHCVEGISRAPALMCSYLIYKHGLDFEHALNFVKSKRDCVDINPWFTLQLQELNGEKLQKMCNSL